VHFYCQKNQSRMNEAQWIERLSFIRKRIDTEGYDLVVFDTLASIWSAKDENDAVGVQASLMPLRTLPCAVLIIHHTRKAQHGDSEDGSAARGSSALTGFVDLILELKRWKAGHRQRLLLAKGRFPSSVTPEESVIERTKDEKSFVLVGNRNEVTEAAEKEALLAAIPYGEPGATVEEIGDTLNGEGPSRTRLFGELKKLQAEQLLGRSGTGKKGSPWVFWRLKGMGVVPNNCSIKFEKDVC
jgi:hypothetical protein